VLAPFAIVSGNSEIDGTVIAAQINDNGEVDNAEFTGDLPCPPTSVTPEPSSLFLFATGLLGLAALLRWKQTQQLAAVRA
jgi:hypothetical protein